MEKDNVNYLVSCAKIKNIIFKLDKYILKSKENLYMILSARIGKKLTSDEEKIADEIADNILKGE